MPKTLILHDTFLYRGGGERLVIMMANALEADIASGFFSSGSYNLREQGFTGAMIPLMSHFFLHEFSWLPKNIAFVCKNGLRHFGLKWSFLVSARRLHNRYDTVILSGDCISAVKHFREKKVLYYCHTIPRYLFDQQDSYEKKVPKFMLLLYRLLTSQFKKAYLGNLADIKTILTNSKNTQIRIKKFTGREAKILYPPVDTSFFAPLSRGDQGGFDDIEKHKDDFSKTKNYFLSFSRLSGIKRVDRIVRAFQQMPDKHLIITYGKNDPERQTIQDLAQRYPNIEMRLSPSDSELRDLIRGAIATIYVPEDEDFGMIPLESMACGTPVIGVNDGGLRESIIDGKTGILIDSRCLPEDIVETTHTFPQTQFKNEDCIARAEDFSLKKFQQNLFGIMKI